MVGNHSVPKSIRAKRLPWLWDYDIDEETFLAILHGEKTMGRLDADWAAVRVLEYAPYPEIVRLIGFRKLVEGWPRWRGRIRSLSRKRGMDFLVSWIQTERPELVR
ncbi:MAG: hypothetical protein GXO82_07770 [Chlorobi bacterium]|nr:hypothetical protein [Chlorobiota bacterium]